MAAVELLGVVKRFGGAVALDGVGLALAPGRIHGLLGENGAGKTTLMGVLAGTVRADAGSLSIDGAPVELSRWTAARAIAAGIGMVHQHVELVGSLTVSGNVVLGVEPRRFGLLDVRRAEREVAELARRHGFEVDPRAPVHALSLGERQRVEILKALHRRARILVLDEPTAVLSPPEIAALGTALRALRDAGCAIAITTHKLAEVGALCDEITVLRGGLVTGRVAPGERLDEGELARMIVGRAVPGELVARPARPGPRRLVVRDLEVASDRGGAALAGVALEVASGEIVGIAGVLGNGQRELVEALAGLRPVRRGAIALHGESGERALERATVRARQRAGLAVIHEDRRRHGLALDLSVARNAVLGRHREPMFAAAWGLRIAAIRREAVRLAGDVELRPADPDRPARSLSGGNQQKLVVGRELARDGALVLVASQPTRGVDLGVTRLIHERLLAARDRGLAILLVSADLDEILALADRVAVLYRGRLFPLGARAALDRETIGRAMAGVA